jgi:hypothetical protein
MQRFEHAFAAESVQRPEQHQVEPALAGVLEEPLEFGATAAQVVPCSAPDPAFSRDAPHSWEEWEYRRNNRIFAEAREAQRLARGNKTLHEVEQEIEEQKKRAKEESKAGENRQRKIGVGWAKYLFWVESDRVAAEAYRREHEDDSGDWLIQMAGNPRFRRRPKPPKAPAPKPAKPRHTPRDRGMGS